MQYDRTGDILLRAMMATVVVAACVTAGFAAFAKDDAGTTTAQFLKLGAGARGTGMGGAFTAVTDGTDSVYWNPAGLNKVEGRALSVMHAAWFEGISYDWASYAQQVNDIGTVGIGIQYLSYGSITGTDSTGLETGSFSPSDIALTLSCARNYLGFDLGASVKYISSRIKNSASAFALDLGAQYALDKKITLGAAVQNLGTAMKFRNDEVSLPLNVRIGGAYAVRSYWNVAVDVNAPVDYDPSLGLGTEYFYKINSEMKAAGRLGYSTGSKDTGGLNGVAAGLGFRYLDYTFDYAFAPYGELGNTHRLSFGMKF